MPATTLLVLDDSAEDREILKRLLASDPRQDYVIHEFDDIDAALAACQTLRPDCVLLDYSLGDGTGLDFLVALRESDGESRFPVVMLTGSGSEDVAARAFRSGAQDYLSKGTLGADVLQRAIAGAIYKMQTERLLLEQRRELERLFMEAQEANARKDQFLATLSHELRTPLTPVLTAVTAANPENLSREELKELFAIIRRNILLEARLIDDLLDLTRIANNKLSLQLRAVDAHEVLHHALDTCHEDIAARKLQVTINAQAARHVVMADPARLQQVYWNVLKNAVKFTPVGGRIQIASRNSSSGSLEVSVRDSGIGIAPEVLPTIFNAFDQGGTDMQKRFGGLGLGLAIAKALVDVHHGAIRAESPGHQAGATFFIELPVTVGRAEASPALAGGQPSNGGCAPAPVESKGRLLLVEDHVDSARTLARVMQKRGYEVHMAHSVAEAVEVFRRQPVDVVVSDIGLPDGDGVDVMNQIRQIRLVPGVALSGYGTEKDISRSHAAGFAEHLIKPVDCPQLEAALERLLPR